MPKSKHHIIVAMSGGVDSSIAAYLLQQQGHHVEGMFMKNWEEDDTDNYCAASEDVAHAQAICDKLGIHLHRINFAAEYWDEVFTHFLEEYRAGRTPNPDILCNKEIKFKAFLDYALSLGADFIATGHYARKRSTPLGHQLLIGCDSNKDQSYFLCALGQEQLARTLFPIGDYAKPEIRALAEKLEFQNFNKKGSSGICFIGERKFKDFLNRYIPAQPGDIKDTEGKIIGKHDGLMFYTLGQRQGLGVGGIREGIEAPWYVVRKELADNAIVVSQDAEHPWLSSKQLTCTQAHWISGLEPKFPYQCTAKIRYRQASQSCHITKNLDGNFQVEFDQPQRAITPGQFVVFYHDEECLGGAVITS